MVRGWVRIWRKIEDNDIIRDAVALQIFMFLLVKVDKTTGEKRIGRFWMSDALNLNPSTFYKGLKRLEKKYKIVTLTSNNKFTTIRLINWHKYQGTSKTVTQDGNNKVTPKEQQSNTLQEYRIENKEIPKGMGKPIQYGNQEINELHSYMKTRLQIPMLDGSIAENRRYANLCIKKFGFDKTKIAIDATVKNKFWGSKVTSFKSLYYHAVEIVTSLKGGVKSYDASKKILGESGQKGISYNGGEILGIKKSSI